MSAVLDRSAAPADFTLSIEIGGVVYPAKVLDTQIVLWHPKVWNGDHGGLRRGGYGPGRVAYDRSSLRRRGSGNEPTWRLVAKELGAVTSAEIRTLVEQTETAACRETYYRRAHEARSAKVREAQAALLAVAYSATRTDAALVAVADAYREAVNTRIEVVDG